jgi:preprotein translocase subunit SecA
MKKQQWKNDKVNDFNDFGDGNPNKVMSKKKSTGRKYHEEVVGRNELCPCGSGKRFKKCCM